jgi:glycosyltransferase involved in cell wall biosynthesis
VLRQSWEHIELIVVNDGSTDRTADIAESSNDSRVRCVHQEHRGASAARNRGVRDATGELLQFLDADDLLSSSKIEVQIAALASGDSSAVASCAWAKFESSPQGAKVHEERVWRVQDPVEWLVRSLSGDGMMQPAGWLVPRSVARAAGEWDESLTLHDDGEYFARVLVNASRNFFTGDATIFYREVAQSLSRRRDRKAIESALAVCKSRHRTLLGARDDREARRAIATQYAQFAYEFDGVAHDLATEALDILDRLGAAPANVTGGKTFRRLTSVVGFRDAMRLRSGLQLGR